jgi:hypothetical protein
VGKHKYKNQDWPLPAIKNKSALLRIYKRVNVLLAFSGARRLESTRSMPRVVDSPTLLLPDLAFLTFTCPVDWVEQV